MKSWILAAACIAAVSGAARVVSQPVAAPTPLEAFGGLPTIEDAEISPDGKRLALIVTNGEQRRVIFEDLATSHVFASVASGDRKLRAIQWAGSDHLLITNSVTETVFALNGSKREWFLTTDYAVESGHQKPVLQGIESAMNVDAGLPDVRVIDGKAFAFVPGLRFVDGTGRVSLYRAELSSGLTDLVQEGVDSTATLLVGADGKLLAATEYDAKSGRWTLKVKRAGNWKVIKTLEAKLDQPYLMGLGRDGRSLLLAVNDDHGALRELAPDADDWGPPLEAGGDAGAIFDPLTGILIGLHALNGDQDAYTFFDPADQATWKKVLKAFPDSRVTLGSLSADRHRLVVLVDSPTEGPAYALVDVAAHTAKWIGPIFRDVHPAPVTPVSFKAADGTQLTGYLTTPLGAAATGQPLVVFPHGGPAARDTPGFDWWAQAMASRGYAVLQVNYRGSDGFGWDFLSAGFGQWGRKMQTDLSDGVRYLAARGTIDPKRVCIVGASYGGYAALAGATLDPGVYRCAVSVSGPADLPRFVSWARSRHDQSTGRYWLRFMGADRTGDPKLADISPAAHADRAAAPILIIHGRDDTVVPFEQSEIMAAALKRAGKPVELVTLHGEDHWLSRGETRLQMLKAVIDFLQKNNPPG